MGQRMLPGVGPRPKHQKMQLEAVNVSFLSREGAPLGSGFPRALSQPPTPQGRGKGGLAAVATPRPSSVIKQSMGIFQLGLPTLFSVGLQEA